MTSVTPCASSSSEMKDFLQAHPDTQYVDLLISDMNGVVRGKRIERASLHKVYEKGIETSLRTGDLHARSELEAALAELG